VLFRLIHDVEQHTPLTREPHTLTRKRSPQFAGLRIDVEPFTRRDATAIIFSRPALFSSLTRLICRSHND